MKRPSKNETNTIIVDGPVEYYDLEIDACMRAVETDIDADIGKQREH